MDITTLKQKANIISKYLEEFFAETKLTTAKPKDVMLFLIKKKVFKEDRKNGLPLREILRQLDDANLLHLIPQLIAERKDKNTYWSFIPTKSKVEKNIESNSDINPIIEELLKKEGDAETDLKLPLYKLPENCFTNSNAKPTSKLIPIADLIKTYLEKKYSKPANYTLSYKADWLYTTPSKAILSKHWNLVCDVYAKINGFGLDLEKVLEKNPELSNSGLQEYDIWFHRPYSFAVEFDEKQHFNQFRLLTLEHYAKIKVGFKVEDYKGWSNRTIKAGKKSSGFVFLKTPDPLFPPSEKENEQDNRIRQRAFRDFLKDIVPNCKEFNPTIRLNKNQLNGKEKNFIEEDLSVLNKYFIKNPFLNNIEIFKEDKNDI